ncbi:RidA family protein [Halomonas elongata]|uniref:RidA family protein n=1 Tax=Halomonas elongata TaxID=2746 RepID=UPI0038D40A6E
MMRESINPRSVADTLQYGFSQAVVVSGGHRIYLSGQVGIDANEVLAGPDIATQTRTALDNIATILQGVGGSLADVVMLRFNVAECARYDQEDVIGVLREQFPVSPPATSWTVVRGLAEPEWLIELVAEAVIREMLPGEETA